MAVSRDTIVAILLLAFTALMWNASTEIEITPYATMASSVWPQIILVGLGIFSALLLAQAVTTKAPAESKADRLGPAALLARYRNALIIYVLFFLFLITLPYLGMLIGATIFVFLALTLLGRLSPRMVGVHALIALGSVGVMWAIFTYALHVILPQGEILSNMY
jgi:putative tricarboxylic transport membrane protein